MVGGLGEFLFGLKIVPDIQCIQSEQYFFFIARGRAIVGVPNFSIPFLSSPYSGFQNMTRNC